RGGFHRARDRTSPRLGILLLMNLEPRLREQLATKLVGFAYVERASAHVLLGWLPRVPDIARKLELGEHAWQAIARGAAIERYVQTTSRIRGGHSFAVPRAWRTRMQAIDRSRSAEQLLERLYLDVRSGLLAAYRALRATLDPLLDAVAYELVTGALRETEAQVAWARRTLRAPKRARAPLAWLRSSRGAKLPRSAWLWAPISRVRVPARPPGLATHDDAGAIVIPIVPAGRRTAAAMLHENIDAEITTMELFARCSYEHPELPEAFHRDMARQTSDESRHARGCLELAKAYGMPHGSLPTSTD